MVVPRLLLPTSNHNLVASEDPLHTWSLQLARNTHSPYSYTMNLNEYSADAHPAVDAIHTDPNRAGAIQETKDKAKAIMMASTLDAKPTPDAAENGPANASLPPSEAAVNGEPKSRKRSRSGERIRFPDSRGAYPIETDTDRYALLRAVERDADYAANKAEEMERVKQLYAAKKDEKVQWDLYWERIINTPAYQGMADGAKSHLSRREKEVRPLDFAEKTRRPHQDA